MAFESSQSSVTEAIGGHCSDFFSASARLSGQAPEYTQSVWSSGSEEAGRKKRKYDRKGTYLGRGRRKHMGAQGVEGDCSSACPVVKLRHFVQNVGHGLGVISTRLTRPIY